jgi:hypothetical protein
MPSQFTLVVNDARDTATVRSDILPEFAALTNTAIAINQGDAWAACDHIGAYFQRAAVGARSINVTVQTGVSASGTATFSTVVAGNTVVVGGVTFTGSNTASGAVQFLTGTTDALSAASLAAVINANTTANKLVKATSSANVVTITAVVPGPGGNFITLTATGVPIVVTGAGFLASGTVGSQVVISEGL